MCQTYQRKSVNVFDTRFLCKIVTIFWKSWFQGLTKTLCLYFRWDHDNGDPVSHNGGRKVTQNRGSFHVKNKILLTDIYTNMIMNRTSRYALGKYCHPKSTANPGMSSGHIILPVLNENLRTLCFLTKLTDPKIYFGFIYIARYIFKTKNI